MERMKRKKRDSRAGSATVGAITDLNGVGTNAGREQSVVETVASADPMPLPADGIDPGTTATPELPLVDPGIERLLDTWVNLEKELAERNAELGSLRLQAAAAEDRLRAAREDLALVGSERDRLRLEAEDRAAQFEEQRRRVEAHRAQVEALQAELAGTRQKLDEMSASEAGRLGRRGAEKRLADYRDALVGLEHALGERELALQRQVSDNADLGRRVGELERQLAEVTGRWREADAANARLQSMLGDAVRGAERVEGDLRQAREGADRIAGELANKAAMIAELQATRSARESAHAAGQTGSREANSQLTAERKRAAALQAELRERDRRLTQLEASLSQQRAALEAAVAAQRRLEEELAKQAPASEATAARQRLEEQIAERDAVAAGMRQRLEELMADRDQLAAELETQRRVGRELESEMRRQSNDSAVLSREIERLKGIESSVRKLGGLMTRHAATASPPPTEKRRTDRLVVSMEGEHRIKYPLYKSAMIIGRAGDADIHVIGRFTSRRHARIVLLDDDTAVIEDLGSLNGVRVNGQVVTRQPLRDGDMLDVGGARLQYLDLGQRESPGSPA